MKNIISLLLLVIVALTSACYNYDGPTRPKRALAKLAPPAAPIRPVVVAQQISSQDYLKKMAGEITKKLPSAQVILLTDSIMVLFPDNIKYSKSAILPLDNINTQIRKLSELIIKFDQTNILISGHTDKTGNEQNNKRISELRAKYILDLLIAYKSPKERLEAWGLGSSSPISSSRITNANDKNRRVEFIVLSTMEDEEEIN